MFLMQALHRAMMKYLEIESQALQMSLINWLVKKFTNFVAIYWSILFLNNLFVSHNTNIFENVLSNFKMQINSQSLTNFQISIDLPLLNNLKIQINIKNENNHNLILSSQMYQILKEMKKNFKYINYNLTAHKKT